MSQSILNKFINQIKESSSLMNIVSIRLAHSPRSQPQADGTYKGQFLKKWGYEPTYHTNGLLPRLKKKESRLRTMPITSREDRWSKRLSTLGANDMTNIFGGDPFEEYPDPLEHVPDYLKGYKGFEYNVLMRKRVEFAHWKQTKPLKWLHMEQRIKFLYRRLNNKYKPPGVEPLKQSRHYL